jgi:hypothetical protein
MIPLGIISSTGSSLVPLTSNLLVSISGSYDNDSNYFSSRGYSINIGPGSTLSGSYTCPDYDVNYIYPQTVTVTLTGVPESGPGESQPLSDKPLIITKSLNGSSLPPVVSTTNSSGQVTFTFPSNWGSDNSGSWVSSIEISFNGENTGQVIYSSSFIGTQTFYGSSGGAS